MNLLDAYIFLILSFWIICILIISHYLSVLFGGEKNNLKLPRPRGADQPCDAITYNPYHLWWIPLSTAAFPTAKTPEEATEEGVLIHEAIRHCQFQQMREYRRREGDQCPWRTCRNGSSKGRIIRTNQIVLLVIQIRLSHRGYLRRWGVRYLSPRDPSNPMIDPPLGPSRGLPDPSIKDRLQEARIVSLNGSYVHCHMIGSLFFVK